MARYLTKTVNTYLVLVIVIILVLIAVFAVYFQEKYGSTKLGFSSCQQDLTSCTGRLATALTNSSSLDSEVKRFGILYENQSRQLDDTQSQLVQTKTELASVRNELSQANTRIAVLRADVSSLNATINTLVAEKTALQGSLNTCQQQLAACQNPP